jgi:hypothetical protein
LRTPRFRGRYTTGCPLSAKWRISDSHGFNFNVEEWFEGDTYETLAICRSLELARAAFDVAIAEKPAAGS